MDTFQPNPAAETTTSTELQEQFDALRHLVVSVLILVLVVSGTLNIYFLRQLRDARRELTRVRPQVAAMMATYQKSEAPMMQTLVNKFTDYARTHPDYAPILSKYGVKGAVTGPPAQALPPSTAPEKK